MGNQEEEVEAVSVGGPHHCPLTPLDVVPKTSCLVEIKTKEKRV